MEWLGMRVDTIKIEIGARFPNGDYKYWKILTRFTTDIKPPPPPPPRQENEIKSVEKAWWSYTRTPVFASNYYTNHCTSNSSLGGFG